MISGAFPGQRIILGIMGFLGVVVCFTMRASLTIAITEMVVPNNRTINQVESSFCSVNKMPVGNSPLSNIQWTSKRGPQYNWTQEQQGWILSSYFIGYALSHIPGTIWIQKMNAKWTVVLSVLVTMICCAITPLIVAYGVT